VLCLDRGFRRKGSTPRVDSVSRRDLDACEMKRRRLLAALSAALLAGALAAVPAGASGGNSANAKLCQKGGWQTAQSNNGSGFASNDDCTSYAASGGVLFAPALSVTSGGCVGFNGTVFAFEHFTATGFHTNSNLSFFLPGQQYPLPVDVLTDVTGSGELPGYVLYDPGPAAITAVDAQGVHATISFTASC